MDSHLPSAAALWGSGVQKCQEKDPNSFGGLSVSLSSVGVTSLQRGLEHSFSLSSLTVSFRTLSPPASQSSGRREYVQKTRAREKVQAGGREGRVKAKGR